MRLPTDVRGKRVLITPYNTKQEKEILLLNELCLDKNYCIDEALRILNFSECNAFTPSETEKKIIIYKYRCLSVGDECSINFTCPKCKAQTRNIINLGAFETPPDKPCDGVYTLDKDVTHDNLKDFLSPEYLEKLNTLHGFDVCDDLDELDLDVYDGVFNDVVNAQSKVNFLKTLRCGSCRAAYSKDFGEIGVILDLISDDTIRNIYDYTNTLIKFGYSKSDVDSLVPFERSVITDLIMEDNNA